MSGGRHEGLHLKKLPLQQLREDVRDGVNRLGRGVDVFCFFLGWYIAWSK